MFNFFQKVQVVNEQSQQLYQNAYMNNKSFNSFVSTILAGAILVTGFFSYQYYQNSKSDFLDSPYENSYVEYYSTTNLDDDIKVYNIPKKTEEDLVNTQQLSTESIENKIDNKFSYGRNWDKEIKQTLSSNIELGKVELDRLEKNNSLQSESLLNNPSLEQYLLENETAPQYGFIKKGSIRGKSFHINDIEAVITKEAQNNPLTLAYAYKNNDYTLLLAHLFIGEYSKAITEKTLFNEKGELNSFIDFIGDSVMVRRALWLSDVKKPTIADAIFQSNGYQKKGKTINFQGVQYASMYAKNEKGYVVNQPIDPFLFDLAVQAAQTYLSKKLNQIAVAPYFFNPKTSTNVSFTSSLQSGKKKFIVTSDNGLLSAYLSLSALKMAGEHTYFAASVTKDPITVENKKTKSDFTLSVKNIENIYTIGTNGFVKTKNGKEEGVALSFAGLLELKDTLNTLSKEPLQSEVVATIKSIKN